MLLLDLLFATTASFLLASDSAFSSPSFLFIDSAFAINASCIFLLFAHRSAPFRMRIVARIMIATILSVGFFSLTGLGGSWTPVLCKSARSALLLQHNVSNFSSQQGPA